MVEIIFDTAAIKLFRARATRLNIKGADFLLQRAIEDMADRLSFVDRTFTNAAIISGNADFVPQDFLQSTRHQSAYFAPVPSEISNWANFDDEQLPSHYQALDLAISFLGLHQTNDTPGALVQIRQALKPDGLFMGVMPGAETLHELKESLLEAETELYGGASPRVYPFADVRAIGALLQRAGFALPVVDSETITVRYSDVFSLMRDLRSMGAVNGLINRSKKPIARSVLFRAAEIYRDKFGQSDGKIPATFTFIWMSGWAPDASQQKPAKRGSATVSFQEALNNIEN